MRLHFGEPNVTVTEYRTRCERGAGFNANAIGGASSFRSKFSLELNVF